MKLVILPGLSWNRGVVSPALRALLEGVIDYAGLFPPASLGIGPATSIYAAERGGADAWMLGRFVCPASRLCELDDLGGELFAVDPPFRFAAIGHGAATPAEFIETVRADMDAIAGFQSRHAGSVSVDVFEVRLPPPVLFAPRLARALIEEIGEVLTHHAPQPMQLYFEALPADDLPELLGIFAEWNVRTGDPAAKFPAGYKLRTGGTEASAFPRPQSIARAIDAATVAGVPMKCTAGLHHPLRAYHGSVQAKMHGFINVLVAAVLAHARGVHGDVLAEVLAEEEGGAFSFTDDDLGWRGNRASISQIQTARRSFASFGSCSFNEPRADLRALGWW